MHHLHILFPCVVALQLVEEEACSGSNLVLEVANGRSSEGGAIWGGFWWTWDDRKVIILGFPTVDRYTFATSDMISFVRQMTETSNKIHSKLADTSICDELNLLISR